MASKQAGWPLQETDGIFPNTAIAKKLGDIMGPEHPPLPEQQSPNK